MKLAVHFRRYFLALAAVLTAFAAYALAVAPWFEPPPLARRKTTDLPPLANISTSRDDLARLFEPGSWELDNPKIVETENCTLLVKDYKPTPDGRLELMPCTLLFHAGGSTDDPGNTPPRMIVMRTPGGALLQFDKALDLANAEFGRLISGRLPGEITITSPESKPGAGDFLFVKTSDVRIDRSRVFVPHDQEVVFQFGQSHGRGRDLHIALAVEDPDAPAATNSPGKVRTITLERLEELHLAGGGQGLLPRGPQAKGNVGEPAADTPLDISCDGPFVYEVAEQVAIFDRNVQVIRTMPAGQPDRLRCERLHLYFAEEAGANPAAQQSVSTVDAENPLAGKLKRLVAIGSPVTIDAPSAAAFVRAARVEYSLSRRRIELMSGGNITQVKLSQQQSEVTARKLEYEMAAAGRLGRLWAAGPGQLKLAPKAGTQGTEITARWEKELWIRPHEGSQVISLIDKASITAEPQIMFSADELHCWINEREVPAKSPVERLPATDPAEPPAVIEPPASIIKLDPDRLLAIGKVELDSPQLNAHTNRLEAWFKNQPAQSDPNRNPNPSPNPEPAALTDSSPQPSLQKFDLRGGIVQMQVLRVGKSLHLDDLTIRGQVTMNETRTPEPGQQPIRISGETIEMHGMTSGPGKVEVIGQPAEISGRGLMLRGSTIHLLRSENRLWIDGPGEARLPAALGAPLPGIAGAQAAAPKPAATSKSVAVLWEDRFHFDGQTADLAGNVQARTDTTTVSSQTLSMTLTERIDFTKTHEGAKPDIARLRFDGGVFITNLGLDEQGEKISEEEVQVKNLTIDYATGTIHADGPVNVRSRRLGTPMPAAGQPMGFAPAGGQGAGQPQQQPLMYVNVECQGPITGDLAKREINFSQDVRTTYAPINDWADKVVVKRIDDLGEKGVLLTSDRLTIVEMPGGGMHSRWIEMYATGNAVIEARSFTVRAPKITYAGDKELLMIEGDGRAEAELWHRDQPGQPPSYGAAQKWKYWLRTGMFDVEGIKTFDFQMLNGGKFRLPGGR